MSGKSYTPERRIVCVGSATVGNALLRTTARLRRSMNDEQATLGSLLVWDTGARCTTLNERIVEALGLEPTGRTVTLALADGHEVGKTREPGKVTVRGRKRPRIPRL